MHQYLVGYITESKHGTQMFGKAIIKRAEMILTSEDIEEIESVLVNKPNIRSVMLLSFSKMEDTD